MNRSFSAVRLKKGNSPAGGQARGLTSSVSLPSLVTKQGAGAGYGFPVAVEKSLKKAPSELLVERREFGHVQGATLQPKITAFLDLSQYSNYTNTGVPVDQPLFSVHPPVVAWTDFEGLQTYEATVTLRNRDSVARRVKVCPPDSRIFELAPGRGRGRSRQDARASTSSAGDKVAPGMEVTYTVRFKPDARIDYNYDLVVITEREKFNVPLRACGGSALLEFPDDIDFGHDNVVGHTHERSVLVRNVGDRPSKFSLRTEPPFSVASPLDYLAVGAATQVSVMFTPEGSEPYERDLHLKYGGMEACCKLVGSAYNAEISMSQPLLVIEDTYVGLETQGTVTIRNDSDVPIDFSWRLFPSTVEERSYRAALHGQLKQEQRDETLYMQQAHNSDDSSDDSCSDEERLRARRNMKVSSGLGRKYGNLQKAIDEDLMLFYDDNFGIEPLQGTIWSHSQLTCACSFRPSDALVYSCTAYLHTVGQEERAPLILKGLGIGPKATFSYDELDVNEVFVESAHRYEVQLLNQGDIEVKFHLVHKDTPTAKQFKFTPESGEIAVGGQCEIVVDFKPKELGKFEEVFEWILKGSAKAVKLKYSGKSIEPTFTFDQDRLNFGVVSFGFLNSRMLTLTNTSEVPIVYTMRIPGDVPPPGNEFMVIPAKGTLLPGCQQRVQVDFISLTEKKYDLDMCVDIEGVKDDLRKIPITAQCATPQVSFEPHGCLNYGDIFIRYPFHASLYVHNTSTLPAKFEVMPQDDPSRAAFEPDQWSGSVPPCASHVITVTLTAHEPGPVRIPMYVKIIGRSVPFPLVLVANSIGPRVIVDPLVQDWGQVRCGEPSVKHIRLTNNSCIDASVRAFMNEKNSLWTVHPKVIHLSPQETLQLAVTLTIDETLPMQDILNLIVAEGEPLQVTLKGRGIHTPVECDQDLEFIDFGMLFTTHHEPYDVTIKNKGQLARRITWFREKDKSKDKDKLEVVKVEPGKKGKGKDAEPKPFVFRVEPDNVVIEPRTAYRFTFYAMSTEKGVVEDTICCNETVDKGGGPGKVIYKTKLRAEFVAPVLRLLDGVKPVHEMLFQFNWERNKRIKPISKTLTLQNTGPLEVGFRVQVPDPFSVDVGDGTVSGTVPPNGQQNIEVEFYPLYKNDRKSASEKRRLTVQYDEHPSVNTVDLIGRVCWPNLELESYKLDFGYVLNETAKQLELKMHNPTALTVAYDWTIAADVKSAGQASVQTVGGRSPEEAAEGGSADGGPMGATLSLAPAQGGDKSEDPVDINQIFDVLPIFGKIEPGETQVATFTYYAMQERQFRAVATCFVDGGPEYEVQIRGKAASCGYTLGATELDFGKIPFTEIGERELVLTNPGKVPAPFNFNLQTVSRNSVDIVPTMGTLQPEKTTKAMVKFRAGIPDQVTETVLVEIAHFEPVRLTVSGCGTFPGIVLGLPRVDEAGHAKCLEESRRRLRGRRTGSAGTPGFLLEGSSAATSEFGGVTPAAESMADGGSPTSATRGALLIPDMGTIDAIIPNETGVLGTDRSLGSDDDDMSAKKVAHKRLSNLDLELEFEVDRHYLCEELLRGHGDADQTPTASPARGAAKGGNATMLSRSVAAAARGRKPEPPAVTAGNYICDFGHIALGQSRTMKFMVYNCCAEPVMVSIDKKTLKEAGFTVEPDQMKQLLPKKSAMMSVTASRPREESEGVSELEWNLPVKGGPNYKVQLLADFVLPDLNMSTEFLDFGKIVVGQRKRMVVEFHNTKAVPVDWSYPEQKDRHGAKLPPDQIIFDMQPSGGTLMPSERKQIFVYFSPRTASQSTASLHLKLRDNPARKKITVVGRGDVMRLEVRPSLTYELGPIMPNQGGASREFVLYNPTDYALEVYSTDFDEKYREEEAMLAEYLELTRDEPREIPVRLPGDGTWRKIRRRVNAARKEKRQALKAEKRALAEAAKAAAEAAAEEAGSADGFGDEPKPEAPPEEAEEESEEEEEIEGEDEEEEVLDHTQYPWRVPNMQRVSTLLIGPPKSGVTTLACRLAKEDLRKVLHIDDAVEWALSDPRFLRPDRIAKRIRERIQAGFPATTGEVAHLLKRRIELMDCNAGVIVDGVVSKYLPGPRDAAEAVLEALRAEKVSVLGVKLIDDPTPEGDAEGGDGDGTVAAPSDAGVSPPEDPVEMVDEFGVPVYACKAIANHYETLQPLLLQHAEELRSHTIPELTHTVKETEEALEKVTVAADDAAKALRDLQEKAEADAEAEVELGEEAKQAAKEALSAAKAAKAEADGRKAEATKSHDAAVGALEEAKVQLTRASGSIGWQPPQPPELEVPPPVEPEPKKAPAAKKKGKKDDGPSPEQLLEQERARQRVAAFSVSNYMELYEAVKAAVEKYNDKARKDAEDRQSEIERKRRARQEAAKKNNRSGNQRSTSRGKQATEQKIGIRESPQFLAAMEKWVEPISFAGLPLEMAPFNGLPEVARPHVPMPLIPAEMPLPHPTTVKILEPPPSQTQRRVRPENFTILTPVPPPLVGPGRQSSKAEAGAEGEEEEVEEPKEQIIEGQTRWIIEPQSEVRLLVHFNVQDSPTAVGNYSHTLGFEMVDDATRTLTMIAVSGVAELPGINSDPRVIFPRPPKAKRPPNGYHTKAFVASLNVYDYGPLLVGRNPACRHPQIKEVAEDGSAEAGGDGEAEDVDGNGGGEREEKVEKVSKDILRHAENIKIVNNSLFPANVTLGLASAEDPNEETSPFIIDRDQLQLGIEEEAIVKVWCFPQDTREFQDQLIARIEHNPEPVQFGLCAIGATPAVILDETEVDFGRMMMNIKSEDIKVKLKNETLLPAKWQFTCFEAKITYADGTVEEAIRSPPWGQAPPEGETKAEPKAKAKAKAKGKGGDDDGGDDDVKEVSIPEEFWVECMEGTLAPGEVKEVRLGFRAKKAATFNFALGLEARDDQNFGAWKVAGELRVHAETFAVDIEVVPDPKENILDFGTVLVNRSECRCFDVVNRGRFPVKYELKVRSKKLGELLQIDCPKGELEPSDKKTFTVTCSPKKVIDNLNDTGGIILHIRDSMSDESVTHGIPPIKVNVAAVYNSFVVTPPRGVNFGPVKEEEKEERSFFLRNTGIFPFDWCLLDFFKPPTLGEGGKPEAPAPTMQIDNFTVGPTSGNLAPDEDVEVKVTFEASGDKDYDSKISVWVDGVQGTELPLALSGDDKTPPTPPATGGAIPGTSTYLLTGQSCIPGINTKDLQTIFEEQFFARTLEDAISIAGRSDVSIFSEADMIFHFGPVLTVSDVASEDGKPAYDGVTERLRLTNPKAIPCVVQLTVRPRDDLKGSGSDDMPFSVDPTELTIPPHGSAQVDVAFRPPRLANFGAFLEAKVPAGRDELTNHLSFELRGDGAVPSVSLSGPRLEGDEGRELHLGRLAVGKHHDVRMALRNDGLLPATVHVEFKPSPHFSTSCPHSLSLGKGEQRSFNLVFHPRKEGALQGFLHIQTVGNAFESVPIDLVGEGYSDEISWDFTEVGRPGGAGGARSDEEPSEKAAPPAPDELNLGEVVVGTEKRVVFHLSNNGSGPFRFQFPSDIPVPFGDQVQLDPCSGFVEAGSRQPISLTFKPTAKLAATEPVPVMCQMASIRFDGDMPTDPDEAEQAYTVLEDLPGMSLNLLGMADERDLQCETSEIAFAPTMMFATKRFLFKLTNSSTIGAAFDFRVTGKNASVYTVKPQFGTVPAEGELEIEVRFSPLEVDNFDGQLLLMVPGLDKPFHKILLAGSALRPWCHVELPPSDYRSRRQSDTPLDPKYNVAEISSLGTHVKNTKRFYVYNPTGENIEFRWERSRPSTDANRPDTADDDPFRCITKRGTILPSKKFEMVFEYAPQTIETKESFWKFMLLGPKVEMHFLVVGTVEEPRVGIDMPCINFGERLLDGASSEKVRLVNKEHIPFSFNFDMTTFQIEGQPQALSIAPTSGVVGPDSSQEIMVTFKPLEERPFNFNVVCTVKRKKEPVVLNVKGKGYKIHASLEIEEPVGRRAVNAGVMDSLDFGMLQVHEERTIKMFLRNASHRNFNYRVMMVSGRTRRPKPLGPAERPPYLTLSQHEGVAETGVETPLELTYAPKDIHNLSDTTVQVVIPAGPKDDVFAIQLGGGAKRSRVEFSFTSHDFGPCFIAKGGATMAGEPFDNGEQDRYERVELIATNRDDTDCMLMTNFQRQPWLDVKLDAEMIEAGGSLRIPIIFSPREVTSYMEHIEFLVNDYTRMRVDIRGKGCPLRLELADLNMQNVDFGVTTGGETVSKHVRVVNRSQRPVTFELFDMKGDLTDKAVSWSPSQPTTLRPRDTCELDLRFSPSHRIASFKQPLYARCDHGVEVRLLQVAGTCHATEMRLSEHSVAFGDVVIGSQATRIVRLHNFGDLGSRFKFEVPNRYRGLISVQPAEGFVRPQEEVSLNVAFHPTENRIQEYRKTAERKSAGKRQQATSDSKNPPMDVGITAKDIRCVLDGHADLFLEATGRCVMQPGESHTLEFTTEVRTKTSSKFPVTNGTDTAWKLKPTVTTTEPAGQTFWSCPAEVSVPAGETVEVEVTYAPLTMTDTGDSSGGAPRSKKHRGALFIGTPDGAAVSVTLEGTAMPPRVDKTLKAEVPCKSNYTKRIPVKNWLYERQRFDVTYELIEPEASNPASQSINLKGINTLDLPPGVERDYTLGVYAYQEGSALVRVSFTSRDSSEFMVVEIEFEFKEAESLAEITLQAACRQPVRHKIAVTNPLPDRPARFTGSCQNPDIRFSPESIEVPPRKEKMMEILFRPVEVGSGRAEAILNSDELGNYPYTVNWVATAAGLERTLVLKAPLGGSVVETFKFMHYARQQVTYDASVSRGNEAKGSWEDFIVETPQVTGQFKGDEGTEVHASIRFQPSALGECKALLTVAGPGGGEYKAMLMGYAQEPNPLGPFVVQNGKTTTVDFRNPFTTPVTFSLQVSNTAFTVPERQKTIDAQTTVQITVAFKSEQPKVGTLKLSCDKFTTGWTIFLNGTM